MSDDPKINLEWTDDGRSFRIVRFIDEGGMGEVYEGVLTQGGQTQRCAIKVLHKRRKKGGAGEDPQNLETRFHREVEILRRFDSPHIVKVLGSGYHDAVGHYYAMEYIPDGKTLATIATDGPLPLDQGELYLRHTLEALRLFARDNLIHRDIKPQNIMIHVYVAKVADFGLGKLLGSDLSEITTTGTSMGTPSCMSPEQVMGGKDITTKCDIYSTGATFFRALIGEILFPNSKIPVEMATAHISQTPTWPQERGAELPERLEDLLMMMVDKTPDNRPTAEQALALLEEKDPDPADLGGLREQIRSLEGKLRRRLGVSGTVELAQLLEQDPERVKAELDSVPAHKLAPLANLHEQAGLHTSRYEPAPMRRYDHLLLSRFYREQAGLTRPEDMVSKRLALEKRRLEMIERRARDVQSKLEDADTDSFESDQLSVELSKFQQLKQPAAPPQEAAASARKSKAPLVVGGIAALALIVGVGLYLVSNAKRSSLRARIDEIKSLIRAKDHEKADAALLEAIPMARGEWYLADMSAEKARLEALREELGEAAHGLARSSLEAAERKLKAWVDPTRQGAADTAELVRQALDRAEESIRRAARHGADVSRTEEKSRALRRTLSEKRKARIPLP